MTGMKNITDQQKFELMCLQLSIHYFDAINTSFCLVQKTALTLVNVAFYEDI